MTKKVFLFLATLFCCIGMFAQNVGDSGNGLKRGFRGIAELGYEVAINDNGDNSPILNLSGGYQLNSYVFLGAGIGLRHYNDNDKTSVPIFFNFRSDFVNTKERPHYSEHIDCALKFYINLRNEVAEPTGSLYSLKKEFDDTPRENLQYIKDPEQIARLKKLLEAYESNGK